MGHRIWKFYACSEVRLNDKINIYVTNTTIPRNIELTTTETVADVPPNYLYQTALNDLYYKCLTEPIKSQALINDVSVMAKRIFIYHHYLLWVRNVLHNLVISTVDGSQ